MICERCHKKEATVHITEVLNGSRTEKYLCQDCAAQEKGMHFQQDFFSDPFTDFFGRDSLFDRLWGNGNERLTGSLSCPSCGTTYQDFRQSGKLGCPSCYEAFREKLRPLFQQAGGSHNHTGKGPKISISTDGDADTSGSVKNPEAEKKVSPEVAELNKKLQQCIKEERYEDAARIRDEIKRISGGEV